MNTRLTSTGSSNIATSGRLEGWAIWLFVAGTSFWLLNLTKLRHSNRRGTVAILVAVALHEAVKKILPIRSDGRRLPRTLSAAFLGMGLIACVLYLWKG